MNTVVRAIDVGYGNTKFVTASDAGQVACSCFPSVAVLSSQDKGTPALGGPRRTVHVPLDGIHLEVGPEVELAADRFRARPLHDNYLDTLEYRALMAGALHYMKLEVVDLLVVGLPVAQYLLKRSALEKQMAGHFAVGRKGRVEVRRVLVVAQPQGALFEYATRQASQSVAQGRNLVIDAGSRTFDWLVTRGMKVQANMSHSVTRGVSDILLAIAGRLSSEIGEEFRDLEAIDRALRSGQPLRIYQKAHELKRYDGVVQHVAEQAVGSLVATLNATYDIENIVLVGGGAALFKKAVKRFFPKHRILEVEDPLTANVRGFQLLGEQYVRERPDLFLSPLTGSPRVGATGLGGAQ